MSAVQAKKINIVQAINMALHDAMELDSSVVVLGEDIADREGGGVFKCTAGLSGKFGTGRVKSTPIAEQAIVGAAVGGALAGLRPVAEIMLMNFTTVAMDQIVNHAAKLRFMTGGQTHVPLVIRTTTGAGFGTGGQHADYLEAWFAHTAGLKVVAPSNPADAYGLLLSCIFDDDPCIFIENLPLYFVPGEAPVPGQRVPIGKAKVVQEGTDITLISYSKTLHEVIAAAKDLAREGVSAEVIDLRTISPLDMPTILASVAKTGRCVIVHEAARQCGVGAEIAANLAGDGLMSLLAPVERVTGFDTPMPLARLEEEYLPSVARILAAVERVRAY